MIWAKSITRPAVRPAHVPRCHLPQRFRGCLPRRSLRCQYPPGKRQLLAPRARRQPAGMTCGRNAVVVASRRVPAGNLAHRASRSRVRSATRHVRVRPRSHARARFKRVRPRHGRWLAITGSERLRRGGCRPAPRLARSPSLLGFILTWHEGQARAMAGQTQQAIELFDQSRHPPEEDAPFGWNLYVDGSIAFLRGDRQALQSARDRLAILPRPENFSPVGTDGEVIEIAWPLNLNVLDAFLRCWGQPYKAAYFCPAPV